MASINPDLSADCHATGSVPIAAYAINEMREVTMCGHHLTRHRAALEAAGWTIIPLGGHTATAGVGTESTGRHFALEQP